MRRLRLKVTELEKAAPFNEQKPALKVDIMLTVSSSESFCSYIACTSLACHPLHRRTLIAVLETRASCSSIRNSNTHT